MVAGLERRPTTWNGNPFVGTVEAEEGEMKVGIDVLAEEERVLLEGKRVGLLSHQSAIGGDGSSSAQILHRTLGNGLVAMYGPEHGFFGNFGAGEKTKGRIHPDWSIPVHTLYGGATAPSGEMLREVDVIVLDLQDLGVRCYTYLSTLKDLLFACSKAGVSVIVADRPVPMPNTQDGPVLEDKLASFVGCIPVPMVYGMTLGEAAVWMVERYAIQVDLHVAKMEGYHREEGWLGPCEGWPEFIPPSPAIRTRESAVSYAALVFTEALPVIDCGRFTSLAFRVFGAPWIRAEAFCEAIAERPVAGVSFSPHRYSNPGGTYGDQELDGVRLTVTDVGAFRPVRTSLEILSMLAKLYGKDLLWRSEKARPEWFDKLYGSPSVREQLLDGTDADTIASGWKPCERVQLYEKA